MRSSGKNTPTSRQTQKNGEKPQFSNDTKGSQQTEIKFEKNGDDTKKQEPTAKIERESPKNKSLILDMDETLLYASDKPLSQPYMKDATTVKMNIPPDMFLFYLFKRPFLKEFLEEMDKIYNIYIYTASDQRYAKALLNSAGITPYVTRLFHRDHCRSISDNIQTKNIFKLGFDPRTTILIDDYDLQTRHAPINSILIKKFKGDPKDRELEGLIGFLKELAQERDVRPVCKKLFNYHEMANKRIKSGSIVIEDDGIVIAEETKDSGSIGFQLKHFTGNVGQLKESIRQATGGRGLSVQNVEPSAMLKMRLASSTLQTHNSANNIVMPSTYSNKPQRFESEGNLPSFIGKSPFLERVSKQKEMLRVEEEDTADTDELAVK